MKISKLFQVTAIGIALMVPTSTMASASELTPQSEQSVAYLGLSESYEFPSQTEGPDRYVGDNDAADNTIQPMAATRAARFIGRIDAHNAHISGSDVSGHVSWTLISGARRKMEVKSTLKAKTGWFGYSTKASSGRVSVWPGGGGGKAAVARYRCNGTKSTKWYTYGEGFAPGTQKPWGYHNGNVVSLSCGA